MITIYILKCLTTTISFYLLPSILHKLKSLSFSLWESVLHLIHKLPFISNILLWFPVTICFASEQTQWTRTSQRHFYCRLVKIQGGLVGMGEVLWAWVRFWLNHSLTLWPWTNYLIFWNSVSCPWKLNNGARNSGVLHWFHEIKYKELYCSACCITCP